MKQGKREHTETGLSQRPNDWCLLALPTSALSTCETGQQGKRKHIRLFMCWYGHGMGVLVLTTLSFLFSMVSCLCFPPHAPACMHAPTWLTSMAMAPGGPSRGWFSSTFEKGWCMRQGTCVCSWHGFQHSTTAPCGSAVMHMHGIMGSWDHACVLVAYLELRMAWRAQRHCLPGHDNCLQCKQRTTARVGAEHRPKLQKRSLPVRERMMSP